MADRHDHSPGHDHGHDHHGHDHGHGHAHGHHHHGPATYDRAFAIGILLNTGFVAAEAVFGVLANSVALLADAAHNLGDVLGLVLAWAAAALARRPPTMLRTFGWGRSSILAALINAMVLLVSVGAIGVEAIRRLLAPEPVAEATVIAVAAIGIAINGATALLFMRGRENDLNIRGAFLHMAADAVVSLGVVIAALAIWFTGWLWLDPIVSLGIAAAIILSTWGLLRDSVHLAMDGVPSNVAPQDVRAYLAGLPGVAEVHDLHIWALSTTETALTAHLVIEDHAARAPDLTPELSRELRARFGIGHATVQVETHEEAAACRLRPDEVV
ncbi:MAG: cation transporter [Proteobacteria bacterium]|nr:cation transporter [Pseudomonadota bacterium]